MEILFPESIDYCKDETALPPVKRFFANQDFVSRGRGGPMWNLWVVWLADLKSGFGEIRTMFERDKFSRVFALALICLNMAAIGAPLVIDELHAVGISSHRASPFLRIGQDWSLPEILNYGQAALCALLLSGLWLRAREYVFLGWSLVFAFVTFDDAARYHERVGTLLERGFGLVALPGLRAHDTGEIIAWSMAAVVLLLPLAWSFRQSRPRARSFGSIFLLLFACLVVFAVGVDMLHMMADTRLVAYVEDGGEMLSVAIACCCALILYRGYQVERIPEFRR